jgi:hypothetical protein
MRRRMRKNREPVNRRRRRRRRRSRQARSRSAERKREQRRSHVTLDGQAGELRGDAAVGF